MSSSSTSRAPSLRPYEAWKASWPPRGRHARFFLECNPVLLARAGRRRDELVAWLHGARSYDGRVDRRGERARGRRSPSRGPSLRQSPLHAGRAKPPGYFEQDRGELVRRLPRPLGRVLDVGCGEGKTGRSLREAGADWISRPRDRSGRRRCCGKLRTTRCGSGRQRKSSSTSGGRSTRSCSTTCSSISSIPGS